MELSRREALAAFSAGVLAGSVGAAAYSGATDDDPPGTTIPTGGPSVEVANSVAGIQEAIDTLAERGGGTVYVEAGTYELSDSPIRPKDGVSIVGAGIQSTVFEITESIGGEAISDNGEHGDLSDVTLSDFRVNGGFNDDSGAVRIGNGNNCERVRATRIYAYNCAGTGVSFRRCADSTIENCVGETCGGVTFNMAIGHRSSVKDCWVLDQQGKNGEGFSHGISIEQSVGCVATGNIVDGAPSNGGLALNAMSHDDGVVSDNTVRNVNQGFAAVWDPTGNVYANNTFVGCADYAMLLQARGERYPRDNVLIGNNIADCGDHGIYLNYPGRNVLKHNNISGVNTGIGAYEPREPSIVVGNHIREVSDAAISLDTALTSGDAVVTNNYATGDVNVGWTGVHAANNRVDGTMELADDATAMANYVSGPLRAGEGGRVHFNVVEGAVESPGRTSSNV
jgi:parallel beta-helix repeat protein